MLLQNFSPQAHKVEQGNQPCGTERNKYLTLHTSGVTAPKQHDGETVRKNRVTLLYSPSVAQPDHYDEAK